MSDVQADATAREFEASRSETAAKHYAPKPLDHEYNTAKCPCCGAVVRVITERDSQTEARTGLEFVSYKS